MAPVWSVHQYSRLTSLVDQTASMGVVSVKSRWRPWWMLHQTHGAATSGMAPMKMIRRRSWPSMLWHLPQWAVRGRSPTAPSVRSVRPLQTRRQVSASTIQTFRLRWRTEVQGRWTMLNALTQLGLVRVPAYGRRGVQRAS